MNTDENALNLPQKNSRNTKGAEPRREFYEFARSRIDAPTEEQHSSLAFLDKCGINYTTKRNQDYVWRIHKTNPGTSALGLARILSGERPRPQQLEQDRARGYAAPARRGNPPHLGEATRPQTRLGRLAQILRLRRRGFRAHPRLRSQRRKTGSPIACVLPHALRPETLARRPRKIDGTHQKRQPTLNDPRKFKAPYIPKERIWQEADRLRSAHPAGRGLPVKVLDLAEFDLHVDLVPVNGLREQLDIDELLMGDLKSLLVDKRAFMLPRLEYRLRFSLAYEIGDIVPANKT